jgi:hypothetical protein
LVEDFYQQIVWPNYLGGISEASQDLMRKAVQEKAERNE